MNDRYTLKDANRLLKLVRVIAAEMVERRQKRRELARQQRGDKDEVEDDRKACAGRKPRG